MRDLSLTIAKKEDFFEAIDLRGGNDFHLSMFAYTRQLVVHCHEEYSSEEARSLNFKNCISKLSSLRRLKVKTMGYYDEVKEMFKYLHKLLSSNSCLQYLALAIWIFDQGLVNNPDMIKELLWNHKFNLQELTITGELPELGKLFEQQQRLNHTHIDASLIRITKLELSFSYLEEDPMPVLEKIPTLRDLDLEESSYMGKEMVCSTMGFPKLIHLQLWCLPNLEKWRVEEGSMPILQHLEIYGCPKLEELPQGLDLSIPFKN